MLQDMANEPDFGVVADRGEGIGAVQPMKMGEGGPRYRDAVDLAIELTAKSAAFRSSLPPALRAGLAGLVRTVTCYYSNLIEGHDTHPVDIDWALKNDFSADPAKRDLQLEATARFAVQGWIDGGGLAGRAWAKISPWVGNDAGWRVGSRDCSAPTVALALTTAALMLHVAALIAQAEQEARSHGA